MSPDLVVVEGLRRTRSTLESWHAARWRILMPWFAGAAAIAALLLVTVTLVGHLVTPDSTVHRLFSASMGEVLVRNGLVLALHAMACVAGFIAGSSLPLEAERYGPRWRAVHDHAGRFAMLFVTAATLFSLTTQAWILGSILSDMSWQLGLPVNELVLTVLPHALIELTALFLPLAAWLIASRRGDWDHLLAATVVTVAIAVPMLVLASYIETRFWPKIVASAVGT